MAGSALLLVSMPLSAEAAPPGCKSIAKGKLDVSLPAGQRSSRMVRLGAGDVVDFSIGGAPGATVTLVSGAGAPQVVLPPDKASGASFAAPADATYVFAIEAGRDGVASVSASCTASGSQEARSKAMDELPVAQIQLETDAEGLARRSGFSLCLFELAATARASQSPIGAWAEASDGGVTALSTDSSDDDVGSAVLSFSANSEIGPDDMPQVLARMDRVVDADDAESQQAITWSAILAADLTFDLSPNHEHVTVASNTRKPAVNDAYSPQQAAQEWWGVTHLHDNRSGSPDATTETAVLRRDTAGETPFAPPMALGGAVPVGSEDSSEHDAVRPPGS